MESEQKFRVGDLVRLKGSTSVSPYVIQEITKHGFHRKEAGYRFGLSFKAQSLELVARPKFQIDQGVSWKGNNFFISSIEFCGEKKDFIYSGESAPKTYSYFALPESQLKAAQQFPFWRPESQKQEEWLLENGEESKSEESWLTGTFYDSTVEREESRVAFNSTPPPPEPTTCGYDIFLPIAGTLCEAPTFLIRSVMEDVLRRYKTSLRETPFCKFSQQNVELQWLVSQEINPPGTSNEDRSMSFGQLSFYCPSCAGEKKK